jgi:hypothetical protein
MVASMDIHAGEEFFFDHGMILNAHNYHLFKSTWPYLYCTLIA